ncbi:MAG: cytochrome c family protein [Kiloniellales bacterium]
MRGSTFSVALALAFVTALGSGQALADGGDAAKGEKVYKKCKACHSLEDGKNKIGPHLNAVVGRAAGAVEGYKYSKAMKESGLTWDEETLMAFLEKPKKFLKGTKMSYAGLKKEDQRHDLIAYLKEAAK